MPRNYIAVSSLVIVAPEILEHGRALLTQADAETTKDYYIIGQSLAASRDQADCVRPQSSFASGRAPFGTSVFAESWDIFASARKSSMREAKSRNTLKVRG